MKYLWLAFLLFTISAKAQQPTKQETVTFLKEAFLKNSLVFIDFAEKHSSGHFSKYKEITFSNVSIDECTLTVSYTIQSVTMASGRPDQKSTTTETVVINLANVREIKYNGDVANRIGYDEEDIYNYSLVFVEVDENGNSVNKRFPFESRKKSQQESNNPQIAKAFNHLRKLCGAKDPIKFD